MATNGDQAEATVSDVTATMDRVRDVLANWPYPPDGGWMADDLDLLPQDGPNGELDLFKRVELVDGALILMSPQRRFHDRVIRRLANALESQAPKGFALATQMDIKIGQRQRPCPDVLVISTAADDDARTSYLPKDVHLVIEVVSPESDHEDHHVKPKIYAEAGIKHLWIVDEDRGKPVIHIYEFDRVIGFYTSMGTHRSDFSADVPFPIKVCFDDLLT